MASIVLAGASSGSTTITPTDGVTATLTLPSTSGTLALAGGASSSISNGTSNVTVNSSGGTVSIATAGTTALTVTTGQLVGIGTSSPTYVLDISNSSSNGIRYKSTSGTGVVAIDSTGTGNGGGVLICKKNGTNYAVIGVSGAINGDSSTDVQIFGDGSSGIRFCVGGSTTPAGTFDSSGNLGINTTSQYNASRFNILTSGGQNGIGLSTPSAANDAATFYTSTSTFAGRITPSGSSTSYQTSSDYRLKENIQPMTGALDKVKALKPITFDWIADKKASQGFIAHELQEIVPDCVHGSKDEVDADGNPKYQGVDTSFLVATLTSAIQELSALVTAQSATITSLTERITALEGK
jgi:hypothetical protein